MQTRRHSLYESLITTGIGMGYAIPLNYVMIHKMVWPDPWTQAIVMTILFTILSIVLKYILRRVFNAITVRHWMREVREYPKDSGDDFL